MNRKLQVNSPAKLNLTFNILGVFPDGYHKIETLFQAVSLEDHLSFELKMSNNPIVQIDCSGPQSEKFPLGPKNLVVRAAELFRQKISQHKEQSIAKNSDFDLSVLVTKNIPIESGLGGGSSNAAAALIALNALFEHAFDDIQLANMACELGADVAFFLKGGTAIGTSRGDKLQECTILPQWFLLLKPKDIAVSTTWAYQAYDQFNQGGNGSSGQLSALKAAECFATQGMIGSTNYLGNVFEKIVFEQYPELDQLRQAVEKAGALSCRLSGSGSTLYGVANNEEHAHKMKCALLAQNYELAEEVEFYIVSSVNHGARLED